MTKVAEEVTAIKIQAIKAAGEYLLADTTRLHHAMTEVLLKIKSIDDLKPYIGCNFTKLQEVFEPSEGWNVSELRLDKGSKTSSRLGLSIKLICLNPRI